MLTDGDRRLIGFRTVYRLNTFPFIHLNVFHAFLNILALTPLMERFENEHGTLMSLVLFFGRESGLHPRLGSDGVSQMMRTARLRNRARWSTDTKSSASAHEHTGGSVRLDRALHTLEQHGRHGCQVGGRSWWDCWVGLKRLMPVGGIAQHLGVSVTRLRGHQDVPHEPVSDDRHAQHPNLDVAAAGGPVHCCAGAEL